jgi:hypothetical protein
MDSREQGNLRDCKYQETQAAANKQPQHEGFSPEHIWVLGAGRFGRIAVERLAVRYPRADLLVVDREPRRLAGIIDGLGVRVQHQDAAAFISDSLLVADQWIVPAVPVHVALLWLARTLAREGCVTSLVVPEAVDNQVPNPYRIPSGTVYASFATFRCPDACSEPERLCTHTGQPRLGNLFERLAAVEVPDHRVEVIRSWQLAPGVGGYQGSQLHAVLQRLQQRPGRVMVATSCRCHAVIDALAYERR